MIAAEVEMLTFYLPYDPGAKIIVTRTEPIEEWCDANIGTKAEFRDRVSDLYPWTCSYSNGVTTWYFAREELATWFKLRWL